MKKETPFNTIDNEFVFSDILTLEEREKARRKAFAELKKLHIQDLFINVLCFIAAIILAVVLYIDFLLIIFSPAVLGYAIYIFGTDLPKFVDWIVLLSAVILTYKVNFKICKNFPYIESTTNRIRHYKDFIKYFPLALKSNRELRDTGKLKWCCEYNYISYLDEFYPNIDKLYMRCSFPVEYFPYIETDGIWYNISNKEIIDRGNHV